MKSINFICVASGNEKYNFFILPFITSVLSNIPNSSVEIFINKKYLNLIIPKGAKQILDFLYKDRVLIRYINYKELRKLKKFWNKQQPIPSTEQFNKSIRWLIKPITKADYTYIGDIDIIYLNKPDIFKYNLPCLEYTNNTYANIIRPYTDKGKRLTGCMFVNTKNYYTKIEKFQDLIINDPAKAFEHYYKFAYVLRDECLLAYIVKNSNIPFHEDNKKWNRKLHGIHTTLNRPHVECTISNLPVELRTAGQNPNGWMTKPQAESFKKLYLTYINTPFYKQMKPFFHKEYIENFVIKLEKYYK